MRKYNTSIRHPSVPLEALFFSKAVRYNCLMKIFKFSIDKQPKWSSFGLKNKKSITKCLSYLRNRLN